MARYKVLKSVAHSMAHSFTSLMNYTADDYVMGHLLQAARETQRPSLRVDLLTGAASPGELLTPPIARSVRQYVEWFPTLVKSHGTDMRYVRAARMTVTFDPGTRRPARTAPGHEESPYVCHVEVEDDRGKLWSSEIRDWWYPEVTDPAAGRRTERILVRLGQIIRSVWRFSALREAAV